MHAAAGFPGKSTWLKAIKKGNFETWPGLTYTNAAKYCTNAVEAIKVHMIQSSQGVRSTKKTNHQARGNKKVPNQVTLEKNLKRKISHHPSKQKNSTYGINP